MNLQPPGGAGSIMLPNGRSMQANPMVTYSARSGLERIKLSGTGTDRATTLTINFFPATKLSGQPQRKSPWPNRHLEERGWRDRQPTYFYGSGNNRLRRFSTLP